MNTHIPSQRCPDCGIVISVKPTSDSEAAFHAAMDSMCAKFETHLRKEHDSPTRGARQTPITLARG